MHLGAPGTFRTLKMRATEETSACYVSIGSAGISQIRRPPPEVCGVIARALAGNRTLWGIHVDGNAAVLDADGFLHVLPEARPALEAPRTQQRVALASATARP